jgi:EAL domain-containing protein (putative c-di-GMP-specific phosphodiesterase class I)
MAPAAAPDLVRAAVERRTLVGLHHPVRSLVGGPGHGELVLGLPGEQALTAELLRTAHRLGLTPQVDAFAVQTGLALLDGPALDESSQLLVGVCATSLATPAFLVAVEAALVTSGVAPERIVLVLDTTAAWSYAALRNGVRRLRHWGLRFGLEGFGASPDAFLLLSALPVDLVRIDDCFVRVLVTAREDQAIVRSLTEQAHGAGCRVLAPAVRDEATCRLLAALGVDLVSGPYVGAARLLAGQAA